MKVLVATHRTQGTDPGDYCWTEDGELVRPWDYTCAERWSRADFTGIETHLVTTTAEVIDRPDLDPIAMSYILHAHLVKTGFAQVLPRDLARRDNEEEVGLLVDWVAQMDVGTILERGAPRWIRIRCWPDGTRVSHPRDEMTA